MLRVYNTATRKVEEFKSIEVGNNNPSNQNTFFNKDDIGTKITSPIIGTAYHAPEPGAKKFVEVGKKVKKGDTVMIIEAMKTYSNVRASKSGVVKKIYINNGSPVEYGEKLFNIE